MRLAGNTQHSRKKPVSPNRSQEARCEKHRPLSFKNMARQTVGGLQDGE